MNDVHEKDDDILAGEYVLGTMQGNERAQFEKKLLLDARLREKVNVWENRFYPILENLEPISPPNSVWEVIEKNISPSDRVEPSGFWNSLGFWRNFSLVTATLLIVISIKVFSPNQEPISADRVMVVLNDQASAGWVVAVLNEHSFQVQAIQPTALPQGQVCQLWMQTSDNELVLLGVLPHTGITTFKSPMTIPTDARYKVSIEAQNSLPIKQPRGKIVFEGELISI